MISEIAVSPGERRIVCEVDKEARKVTYYVREGFGDGTDGCGNRLANPETAERDSAIRTFTRALDAVIGNKEPVKDRTWPAL